MGHLQKLVALCEVRGRYRLTFGEGVRSQFVNTRRNSRSPRANGRFMANDDSDSIGTKSAETSTHLPNGANALTVTEAAFRQREKRIRAITEFREGQFDVNAACTRFFGALPQINEMRPLIEETFRNFDLATFDDFEGRVHAAHYCNAMWLSKTTKKIDVAGLAAELDLWITKMKETCEMLVPFGKVTLEQLKRLGKEGGYGGKINDVTLLLSILRHLEPGSLTRTMVSPSGLAEVEVALLTFQGAIGKRQVVPIEREEASLLRLQSLTYMLESFDLALKAAIYLYGETEGKQLVPSPYADRGNRKTGRADADSETSEGPTASADETGANTGPAGPEPFVMTNPTGLPLTNPFDDTDKKTGAE